MCSASAISYVLHFVTYPATAVPLYMLSDEATRKKGEVALNDLLERVRASKDVLVSVGYNETAIESFWEVRTST